MKWFDVIQSDAAISRGPISVRPELQFLDLRDKRNGIGVPNRIKTNTSKHASKSILSIRNNYRLKTFEEADLQLPYDRFRPLRST